MDITVTQTEICKCGREIISVTGVCGKCVKEGADLFWALTEGKITFARFMEAIKIRSVS